MAFPTIIVNNGGTGSDTAASGAGPSTAVSGTGASLDATATVDLSADSPNIGSIATDGSAVLWVDTTSGRMFGRITSVDAMSYTVTVHAAFDVTESSRNWGIGGKRATTAPTNGTRLGINVVPADSDGEAWTIEIEYTGTAYDTINLYFGNCGAILAPFTFKGSGASRPELLHDQASTTPMISGSGYEESYVKVDFLDFHANRSTSMTSVINAGSYAGLWHIKNCEVRGSAGMVTSGAAHGISQNINRWMPHATTILENCHIHHLGGSGLNRNSGSNHPSFHIFGCKIHDMAAQGLMIRSCFGSIDNCEIYDCGGVGIDMSGAWVDYPGLFEITNTVVHSCDGDGIKATDHFAWAGAIRSCSITDNGGYGLNSTGQLNAEDYNLFNGNSSGSANNHTIGSNSITSVPQYTDSASGDFTRSGTNRKAVGGPPEIGLVTGTRAHFVGIGSLQEEAAAAGGSPQLIYGGLVS